MNNVLLVDDDVELAEMLADYLRRDGFGVQAVYDGATGVTDALSGRYGIVVMDVMMPGMSGIEALGRIRLQSQIPVLMLTGKGDDIDRISDLSWVPMTMCQNLARPESSPPESALSSAEPKPPLKYPNYSQSVC